MISIQAIISISAILIGILLCIIGWYVVTTHNTYIVRIKKNQIMEFKTSMELANLPIIVFYQGKEKYNFLLDTGSNVSYINKSSEIKLGDVKGSSSFLSASGEDNECSVCSIKLYHNNTLYEQEIRVADLDAAFMGVKQEYGISLTGILGNDFFTKYKYCLDFKELVCYSRK